MVFRNQIYRKMMRQQSYIRQLIGAFQKCALNLIARGVLMVYYPKLGMASFPTERQFAVGIGVKFSAPRHQFPQPFWAFFYDHFHYSFVAKSVARNQRILNVFLKGIFL